MIDELQLAFDVLLVLLLLITHRRTARLIDISAHITAHIADHLQVPTCEDPWIETVGVWMCDFCDAQFESKDLAGEHEMLCIKRGQRTLGEFNTALLAPSDFEEWDNQ